MLKYDKNQNLLTLYKVENPVMGDRFDLLKDIKESYQHFLDTSVFDALEVINECLNKSYGVTRRLTFSSRRATGNGMDEDHVQIIGRKEGDLRTQPITIVDLPYMDNLGKLHFQDRTIKSLVNKISSADDMSYDAHKNILSIVLKKKTIKVECASKTYDLRVRGKRKELIRIPDLVQGLAHIEGEDKDIHGIIRNPLLQPILQKTLSMAEGIKIPYQMLYEKDTMSGTGLMESLTTDPDYLIGNVRDSLNDAVSLDRAIGEVLSRPVLQYPKGTFVTPAVLQDIKKNKINCIYIETLVPSPTKQITGGLDSYESHVQYTRLEKGWRVRDYLKRRVPALREFDTVPEDMMLEGEWIFTGQPATLEILEFLYDSGRAGVRLGINQIPHPFETEVIGNYTLRYGDLHTLSECKARGVSPMDWFYYQNNPEEKASFRREQFSSDDWIAIYSTLGYMRMRNINLFMDRDRDFLKKVELSDVTMKKALATAIRSHVHKYSSSIVSYMAGTGSATRNNMDIFGELTSTLKKVLNEEGSIESPDMTNFIAEISQATHVTNKIKEAPEVMRQIATPYYGRICPFETPEGKQLGLVNNKAIGCHISDGNMMVPVRRVVHSNGLLKVSDTIEELSVKEEVNLRISDILQLKPSDKKGYYEDTRIIAKVPNPSPNGERLIFADIYASDLDYVYAHTEGFISATTALIPFVNSDDAVRASFGSKMIKSAIYLLNPDIPHVQTFMYRTLFESSEAYLVRAKKSGTVVSVDMNMFTVMYDGDKDETSYSMEEFKVNKDAVVFIRYKVNPNDRFVEGQILADCSASKEGIYCPGKDELVGFMASGYNYEDALHVAERTTLDYISIGSTSIIKKKHPNSKLDSSGMFKYYKRGDVIAKLNIKTEKGEDYVEEITVNHGSGIWYSSKEVFEDNQTCHKLDLMGYNKLQVGDKMSGLHGDKGVVSKVSLNSQMPMLANGETLRILKNPHGLPSRMNMGQIYNSHAGLIAVVLNTYINSDPYNGATPYEIRMLMCLAHDLANAPSTKACRSICSSYLLPEDYVKHLEEVMPSIMKWANTFDKNGDARVWNPVTGKWFPFPITIGVPCTLKMKQEAETKIHVRAGLLEEAYQLTSGQPTHGGSRGGGQGMGEMEFWAIAAYGASQLLYEMCNTKSDNETDRVNSELSAIKSEFHIPEKFSAPRSLTNFMYILESFGLVLDDDTQTLPDVSYQTSIERYIYDVKKLIANKNEADIFARKENDSARDEALVDRIMRTLF